MNAKPKRLYHRRRRLTPDERRMRDTYTRVWVDFDFVAKAFLRVDQQEFEVCDWTERKRADWFADQLAIALARLVKNETTAKEKP